MKISRYLNPDRAAAFLFVALAALSLVALVFGRDAPAGGFSAGLLAGAAFIAYLNAFGVPRSRRLLPRDLLALVSGAALVASIGGLLGLGAFAPFLTNLRANISFGIVSVGTSVQQVFSVCIFVVLSGSIAAMALEFAAGGGEK